MKGNKKIFFLVVIVSLFCISFRFDSDYVKVKANENIKIGIDISYHQGDVDWKAIKETGIDFVMLRIGYDYVMDSKFESYLKGAKSIGVDIGVYFYSYADSVEDAINEAENCVKWLNKYPATFTYPIVYDVEENKIAKFAAKASEAFCKVLSDNGYYPMIYASTSWLNDVIAPLSTVSHIEFWQANYYSSYKNKTPSELKEFYSKRPKLNSFDENVKMWQCSDWGLVDGIKGGVDVNISYVDFSEIITKNGFNGFDNKYNKEHIAVCKENSVNLRSEPTTISSIVRKLNLNDEVKLIRKINSMWLEIEIDKQKGYVYADYFAIKKTGVLGGDNSDLSGSEEWLDKGENEEDDSTTNNNEHFFESDNFQSDINSAQKGCASNIGTSVSAIFVCFAVFFVFRKIK